MQCFSAQIGWSSDRMICVPSVVAALSLSSFWVPRWRERGVTGRVARLGICCTAMMLDVLQIQYAGFVAPPSGDSIPTIGKHEHIERSILYNLKLSHFS